MPWTAGAKVQQFDAGGCKAIPTVQAPRGGDFCARDDHRARLTAERNRLGQLTTPTPLALGMGGWPCCC
jgi:hypothetical protein